jgi:hypothetical protein
MKLEDEIKLGQQSMKFESHLDKDISSLGYKADPKFKESVKRISDNIKTLMPESTSLNLKSLFADKSQFDYLPKSFTDSLLESSKYTAVKEVDENIRKLAGQISPQTLPIFQSAHLHIPITKPPATTVNNITNNHNYNASGDQAPIIIGDNNSVKNSSKKSWWFISISVTIMISIAFGFYFLK